MDLFRDHQLIYYLSLSFGIKVLLSIKNGKKRTKSAKCVGKVSRLVIFPVKSMRGVDVDVASCAQLGIRFLDQNVFDRCFMVVNGQGTFITGRGYPKLTTISVQVKDQKVFLDVDDMETLILSTESNPLKKIVAANVWGEGVQGQDCGDEAAEWICKVLNKPNLRMVFGAEGLQKRDLTKRKTHWVDGTKSGDGVTYADGFPIMMLSTASVDDLQKRVPDLDLVIDQFRPNIVITGCEPYDEDSWRDVWIGDTKFSNLKPCTRCIFTTIDPRVGKKHEGMEPLRTLRQYRLLVPEFKQSPIFGVNLVIDTPGRTIRVGDPVYVLQK